MNFTVAELTRIKLEPGEVLSVKLFGDDYEIEDIEGLKAQLNTLFPNNKVIIFALPNGSDLQMEAISGTTKEDNEIDTVRRNLRLAQIEETKKLIEQLNRPPAVDNSCASPISYCDDCGCGKKAMMEGAANAESQSESNGTVSAASRTTDDRD